MAVTPADEQQAQTEAAGIAITDAAPVETATTATTATTPAATTPAATTPVETTPSETSQDRLEAGLVSMIDSDNEVMAQARKEGARYASSRGLGVSSYGARAAEGAVLDRAIPLVTAAEQMQTQRDVSADTIASNEDMQTEQIEADLANLLSTQEYNLMYEDVVSDHQQILQGNADAAELDRQYTADLAAIYADPSTSSVQKRAAAAALRDSFEDGLELIESTAGIDLSSYMPTVTTGSGDGGDGDGGDGGDAPPRSAVSQSIVESFQDKFGTYGMLDELVISDNILGLMADHTLEAPEEQVTKLYDYTDDDVIVHVYGYTLNEAAADLGVDLSGTNAWINLDVDTKAMVISATAEKMMPDDPMRVVELFRDRAQQNYDATGHPAYATELDTYNLAMTQLGSS